MNSTEKRQLPMSRKGFGHGNAGSKPDKKVVIAMPQCFCGASQRKFASILLIAHSFQQAH
jgi:hypothetical protein